MLILVEGKTWTFCFFFFRCFFFYFTQRLTFLVDICFVYFVQFVGLWFERARTCDCVSVWHCAGVLPYWWCSCALDLVASRGSSSGGWTEFDGFRGIVTVSCGWGGALWGVGRSWEWFFENGRVVLFPWIPVRIILRNVPSIDENLVRKIEALAVVKEVTFVVKTSKQKQTKRERDDDGCFDENRYRLRKKMVRANFEFFLWVFNRVFIFISRVISVLSVWGFLANGSRRKPALCDSSWCIYTRSIAPSKSWVWLTLFPKGHLSSQRIFQFDRENHKTFLKRTRGNGFTEADFYVGAKVNVFGRQISIVDYADEITRTKLRNRRERWVEIDRVLRYVF